MPRGRARARVNPSEPFAAANLLRNDFDRRTAMQLPGNVGHSLTLSNSITTMGMFLQFIGMCTGVIRYLLGTAPTSTREPQQGGLNQWQR